jgi:hypothetical protein
MGKRLALAAVAVLLLAGCETAFVGRAPSGRYDLVQVDGRPLPAERRVGGCSQHVAGGSFTLDSIARRFEIAVDRHGSCGGAIRLSGSYLRSAGRLTLEAEGPGAATLVATESGRSITLSYDGLRLRFTQPRP